ncbi:nicotinamide riboside transporter PnuC [Gordonia sp. CPCC 205515]|uniref:nicotinamide riboside transporter PnuC n=1 Tax=Gordonia sp. CPCC 205515 TaxID=3140791 RepID=UPI003AF3A252
MLSWWADHWGEVVGFVTGFACVLLAARRNILNFPIGIANNIVFIVLFVSTGLYANATLQAVFLVIGVHGWLNWHAARLAPTFTLRTPRRAVVPLVVAAVAIAAIIYALLRWQGGSVQPLADATTTAVSLTAQYMLNRRWLENWLVWIGVDIAYIGLYLATGLPIVALLYVVFIGLCVQGFRGWRADLPRTSEVGAS